MDGFSTRTGTFPPPCERTCVVSFTTARQQRLFSQPELARAACRAMTERQIWYRARLLAWVLMPDAWHGLIALGRMDQMSVVVHRLKTHSARRIRQEGTGVVQVWDAGFMEHPLRDAVSARGVACRMLERPRRAGLAEGVADYPYWDSHWLPSPDGGMAAMAG